MMTDVFSLYFSVLPDPRPTAKILCSLFDVIFLSVCTVIPDSGGWQDIEDFAQAHKGGLQEKSLFPTGIPVHDALARII